MADRTFDVDVLETGTFKGVPITESDLDQIVSNFAVVGTQIRPPIKLGHAEAQILAGQRNGQPALGWVSRLRRAGNTLVATVTDVPQRLAELIAKKRYRRVSTELSLDFAQSPWEANLKSGVRGKVLTGLALLGADLPAVATLEDLSVLLASDDSGSEFAIETVADAVTTISTEAPATGSVWLMSDIPRTTDPDGNDAGVKDNAMPDVTAETIDELKAELATLHAERTTAAEAQDAQSVALQAEINTLKTDAQGAREREALAVARQHEHEADQFVQRFSTADCLKLTTDVQRGAARALYVALSRDDTALISGEQAVTLKLSAEATDMTGADVLRVFLDAMPDHKVTLTALADPTSGQSATDDPYRTMLQSVAKDQNLNLDVAEDLAKAAGLVAQSDAVRNDPTLVGIRSDRRGS